MRTTLGVLLVVCAGVLGEIAVAHTMKRLDELSVLSPRALVRVIGRAFRVSTMWVGVGLMTVAFFALLALLSWEHVSFVVPTTALSYAVGAVGAKYLLGECITPTRWAGVLLVTLGVALVWVG